ALRLCLAVVSSAVGAACTAQPLAVPPLRSETRADLQAIAQSRIFFSHHSVGRNVMAGLTSFAAEAGVPLRFVEVDGDATGAAAPAGAVFLHASGGANGEPDSKLGFFASALGRLADRPPELALMKFCYVDFNPQTDPNALFARYQATVDAIRKASP